MALQANLATFLAILATLGGLATTADAVLPVPTAASPAVLGAPYVPGAVDFFNPNVLHDAMMANLDVPLGPGFEPKLEPAPQPPSPPSSQSSRPRPLPRPEVKSEEKDKPAATKSEEHKSSEAKPTDNKPAESKPAEVKPTDTKPAETKPTQHKNDPTKVAPKYFNGLGMYWAPGNCWYFSEEACMRVYPGMFYPEEFWTLRYILKGYNFEQPKGPLKSASDHHPAQPPIREDWPKPSIPATWTGFNKSLPPMTTHTSTAVSSNTIASRTLASNSTSTVPASKSDTANFVFQTGSTTLNLTSAPTSSSGDKSTTASTSLTAQSSIPPPEDPYRAPLEARVFSPSDEPYIEWMDHFDPMSMPVENGSQPRTRVRSTTTHTRYRTVGHTKMRTRIQTKTATKTATVTASDADTTTSTATATVTTTDVAVVTATRPVTVTETDVETTTATATTTETTTATDSLTDALTDIVSIQTAPARPTSMTTMVGSKRR